MAQFMRLIVIMLSFIAAAARTFEELSCQAKNAVVFARTAVRRRRLIS